MQIVCWYVTKNAPTSHMYAYTCKCRLYCGTMVSWDVVVFVTYQRTICIYMYKHADGTVVCYKNAP